MIWLAPLRHCVPYKCTSLFHCLLNTVEVFCCRFNWLIDWLIDLMDWLMMNSLDVLFCMWQTKNRLQDVEAVQNEIVGQAHLENYALKLFLYADNEDRAGQFGKYVAICTSQIRWYFAVAHWNCSLLHLMKFSVLKMDPLHFCAVTRLRRFDVIWEHFWSFEAICHMHFPDTTIWYQVQYKKRKEPKFTKWVVFA